MMQKKCYNRILFQLALILSLLLVGSTRPVAAQGSSVPINGQLYGEPIIGTSASGSLSSTQVYEVTPSGMYGHDASDASQYGFSGDFWYKAYSPPPGRTIVKGDTKIILYEDGSVESDPIILLDDGSLVLLNSKARFTSKINTTSTEEWTKAVGDAIYALTTLQVYVSRDSLKTWQVDTAGLGATHVWDIAVDTEQYVFAATSTGLFIQNPDSNIWHLINSIPANYMQTIFVDRKDRIYTSTVSGSVYVGTDGGQSWNPHSSGLNYAAVTNFGDDAYHNVYAIAGDEVFRSDSGTSAWTRIDTAISRMILDPISSYASPFNYIAGDSLLYLGTNYGLFSSSDRGNSWHETNRGIQAGTIYGYVKTAARQFASTGLGLYYEDQGDTVWTKAFPANGYAVGNSIYADINGTLYTLGPIINVNNSQSPNANWKSTDNGTTWNPDTAGLGAMAGGSIPKYFADESGVQHYAVSGVPAQCFKKSAGSSWTPDTAGWGKLPGNYPNIIASDLHGNIYAAVTTTTDYTGLLMKRPIGGGTWVFDTAGLQGAIVYSISVDQSGNLYAGTFGSGVYKRTGSTWAPISSPGGLLGNDAFVTAVDNSGALFAGFSYQNGFNYAWQGVYFTTNNGGSWTKVGLDGLAVRALIAYGDSVYAVTYTNGMYILSKTGSANGVKATSSNPNTFALSQNYPNPFNPTTMIEYQLKDKSFVTLTIFDVLGRRVATLVDGEQNGGSHSVPWDASSVASGVYFYRLKAGDFVETKKMLLMK
jgi:photosystem II stability/assembly factor-like uncharacterized protein